jgi:hypothetical protein
MPERVKIVEVSSSGELTEKTEEPCKKAKLQTTMSATEIEQMMALKRAEVLKKKA